MFVNGCQCCRFKDLRKDVMGVVNSCQGAVAIFILTKPHNSSKCSDIGCYSSSDDRKYFQLCKRDYPIYHRNLNTYL